MSTMCEGGRGRERERGSAAALSSTEAVRYTSVTSRSLAEPVPFLFSPGITTIGATAALLASLAFLRLLQPPVAPLLRLSASMRSQTCLKSTEPRNPAVDAELLRTWRLEKVRRNVHQNRRISPRGHARARGCACSGEARALMLDSIGLQSTSHPASHCGHAPAWM